MIWEELKGHIETMDEKQLKDPVAIEMMGPDGNVVYFPVKDIYFVPRKDNSYPLDVNNPFLIL